MILKCRRNFVGRAGETGETLALHCLEPATQSTAAVLFIHGASFPTMLAAGFEFEGKDSWMDFVGFGDSSSPRAMLLDPAGASPVDNAADAESQISVAVQYLLKTRGIKQLHIVAHSWGKIPAALYVARHPATAHSLTLSAR
jgi:pimeloyl-ACP methyl ester carboxylesterase